MSDVDSTLTQRGGRYGSIKDNSELTQALMGLVINHVLESGKQLSAVHMECLHMIFHKISRMVVGDAYYADNAHDIAGYARLLEDYINEVMLDD